VGMFVARGAVQRVNEKRKGAFYEQYVAPLTHEAKRLSLTLNETTLLIERSYEEND